LRVPDAGQFGQTGAASIDFSAGLRITVLALLIVGSIVLAPLLLDTYTTIF
jgi:hypothetical protein